MSLLTIVNQLMVVLLAVLLVAASVSDVRRYRIPNVISASILVLFFVWYFTKEHTPFPTTHLVTFALTFAVCFGMFAVGVFGGGDVKLLSSLALWAGGTYFFDVLLMMALSGGIMALLVIGNIIIRRYFFNHTTLTIRKSKLPYGLAISCGGWLLAWQYAEPLRQWLATRGVA
jgi:prepilin peptidase CpaA